MVTIPWWFVRYGFPALALAAATAVVVVARPAIQSEQPARPAPATTAAEPRWKPDSSRTASAQASLYSVRSGDTLAVIAERFGTTVDRLMELNPGIDPRALRVGETIHVP